jgi:hypothetical protein
VVKRDELPRVLTELDELPDDLPYSAAAVPPQLGLAILGWSQDTGMRNAIEAVAAKSLVP